MRMTRPLCQMGRTGHAQAGRRDLSVEACGRANRQAAWQNMVSRQAMPPRSLWPMTDDDSHALKSEGRSRAPPSDVAYFEMEWCPKIEMSLPAWPVVPSCAPPMLRFEGGRRVPYHAKLSCMGIHSRQFRQLTELAVFQQGRRVARSYPARAGQDEGSSVA